MNATPKQYEPQTDKPDQTIAIVGLIATILGILPGLWTIIAGPKYRTQGIVQLALYLVSVATLIVLVVITASNAAYLAENSTDREEFIRLFTRLGPAFILTFLLQSVVWIWAVVTTALIVRDSNERTN